VINAKKIEALKQKYAGAKGADIFNPSFAAVAAQVLFTELCLVALAPRFSSRVLRNPSA